MADPEIRFDYELTDDEGKSVAMTPGLEIDEREKQRGAVGMLEWCKRVVDATCRWGFLPKGGCAVVTRVKISLMIHEDGKWQSLMDMSITMGNDGFARISGKFPLTIV